MSAVDAAAEPTRYRRASMTPQPEDYPTDEAFVRAYFRNRVRFSTGTGSFRYHDVWVHADHATRAKCIGSSQKAARAWAKAATYAKKQIAIKQNSYKAHELIRRLKRRPCTDCGKKYPYYVMEFDHVMGTKLFSLHEGWNKHSLPVIREEIRKCELVCCNCHRIRTFTRKEAKKIAAPTTVLNLLQATD
jgi:hypothetical protein